MRRRGGGLGDHAAPARPAALGLPVRGRAARRARLHGRLGVADDDWLDALIAQLDHVRTEFGGLLAQRLPEAGYVPPEASYLAWVDCARLDLGPEPAEVFLGRGRVALGRGLDFGPPGDGFVRVTIGTSSALLADIVDRMAAAVG